MRQNARYHTDRFLYTNGSTRNRSYPPTSIFHVIRARASHRPFPSYVTHMAPFNLLSTLRELLLSNMVLSRKRWSEALFRKSWFGHFSPRLHTRSALKAATVRFSIVLLAAVSHLPASKLSPFESVGSHNTISMNIKQYSIT